MVAVAVGATTPDLFSVNIGTGQRTLIKKSIASDKIKAIGYNSMDNTLYGVADTHPQPSLVKIGAKGGVIQPRQLPAPADG